MFHITTSIMGRRLMAVPVSGSERIDALVRRCYFPNHSGNLNTQ
jgi:hypothetical protein